MKSASGLAAEKLISCPPTINFGRFYKPGRRPPTRRVLCTGPATRKKAHSDFIDLAASMRGTGFTFDLYAKGIYLKATSEHNEQAGHVVNMKYTDPDEMPEVYPQYDWLVYPGDKQINKVGFPVSIPEAQASGLGVCWQELPGRREEQLEFLGGGGFLFRSISEVPAILEKPYPEDMRLRGFEAAKRCDVAEQKRLFTDAWSKHERAFANA